MQFGPGVVLYDFNRQHPVALADPVHRDLVAPAGPLTGGHGNHHTRKSRPGAFTHAELGPEIRPGIGIADDQSPSLADAGPVH